MNKTKIEWCDSTWNPVTGCMNGCEYCYARKIAHRFTTESENHTYFDGKPISKYHELDNPAVVIKTDRKSPYPFGFEPTFHRYRLNEPQKWTKPRTILVCSMADLFGDWIPDGWLHEVFAACEKSPYHRYMFLTKNPKRYIEYGVPIASNMWYGMSITRAADFSQVNKLPAFNRTFLSIEPLLEDLKIDSRGFLLAQTDWIIIGAETGHRSGKVVPQKKWVMDVVRICRERGKPVFMKDSLIPIVGEENMIREFPFENER